MIDRSQVRHDPGKPPRRKHQRIATGQDHLPDFRMRADIVECAAIGALRQRGRLARPDHFAAKTKTAIDGADVNELEQHPVGVAVHNTGNRRMAVIADRIGVLAGPRQQFLGARNELARDGIVGITRVDQRGDVGRYRHRIARRDLFHIRKPPRGRQTVGDEFGWFAQGGRNPLETGLAHVSPAGGVHTT